MKKTTSKVKIFVILILTICALSLIGCDSKELPPLELPEITNALTLNEFVDKNLTFSSANSFVGAGYDEGGTYLIYNLGKVQKAHIQNISDFSMTNYGGTTISFSEENITSDTISEGISSTVADFFENNITVSAVTELKIPLISKLGVEFSYSRTWGEENSTTKSYENARTIGKSKANSISQSLDNFPLGERFYFALFADVSLYQKLRYNPNGDGYAYAEETIVPIYSISSYYCEVLKGDISDDTGKFSDEQTKKFLDRQQIDKSLLFAGGDGTINSPYLIKNKTQFISIALAPEKAFKLVANLDFGGINWENQISFSGDFDGNDKQKSNFKINQLGRTRIKNENYGLFSEISEHGKVYDLTISNASVNFTAVANQMHHDGSGVLSVGFVCGYGKGTIENIKIYDSSLLVHRSYAYSGAIAGRFFGGAIKNCEVGGNDPGFTMYVDGVGGGIVGFIENGDVNNCKLKGCDELKLYAQYNRMQSVLGGIAGVSINSIISRCEVSYAKFVIMGSLKGYPTAGFITGIIKLKGSHTDYVFAFNIVGNDTRWEYDKNIDKNVDGIFGLKIAESILFKFQNGQIGSEMQS